MRCFKGDSQIVVHSLITLQAHYFNFSISTGHISFMFHAMVTRPCMVWLNMLEGFLVEHVIA